MNDTTTAPGDVKIEGSGTVATGTYRAVKVAGSATISGDVDCETLKVNGAANGRGSLKAGTVIVNGALTYSGDVDAGEMRVNGTVDLRASLRVGSLHVAGSADVAGDVTGDVVNVRGYLNVKGDCQAERFSGEGGFTVGGLLNAGAVDITLWAPCKAGEIGGEAIMVRFGRGSFRRLLAAFVPLADIRLTCESIEGDDVRLEHTTARTVRGGSVVIGPNCDIGLVEYTESYSAAPDAKVKEYRKVEGGGSEQPQASGEQKQQD